MERNAMADTISVGSAARALGVARRTVYYWCHSGKLAHRRLENGGVLIRRRDLAKVLRARRNGHRISAKAARPARVQRRRAAAPDARRLANIEALLDEQTRAMAVGVGLLADLLRALRAALHSADDARPERPRPEPPEPDDDDREPVPAARIAPTDRMEG
jgi:excisionase family DNA binding protein